MNINETFGKAYNEEFNNTIDNVNITLKYDLNYNRFEIMLLGLMAIQKGNNSNDIPKLEEIKKISESCIDLSNDMIEFLKYYDRKINRMNRGNKHERRKNKKYRRFKKG